MRAGKACMCYLKPATVQEFHIPFVGTPKRRSQRGPFGRPSVSPTIAVVARAAESCPVALSRVRPVFIDAAATVVVVIVAAAAATSNLPSDDLTGAAQKSTQIQASCPQTSSRLEPSSFTGTASPTEEAAFSGAHRNAHRGLAKPILHFAREHL